MKKAIKDYWNLILETYHYHFSSEEVEAEFIYKQNPFQEFEGHYLGFLLDYQKDQTFRINYDEVSNIITTRTESDGHFIYDYYSGVKLESNGMRQVVAYGIFKNFARTIFSGGNRLLPTIPTNNGFYSFIHLETARAIKFIDRADYTRVFLKYKQKATNRLNSLLTSAKKKYSIEKYDAAEHLNFLFPRKTQGYGRRFYKNHDDNLMKEVTDLLSPLDFEKYYYLNINNLLTIGKIYINNEPIMCGAYANKIYEHDDNGNKKEIENIFEIKLQSVLCFTLETNLEAFQQSNQLHKAINKSNNEDLSMKTTQSVLIDEKILNSTLKGISDNITQLGKMVGNVQVKREPVLNSSKPHVFRFYVVIKGLNSKQCDDGKEFVEDYANAIDLVQGFIKTTLESYGDRFQKYELDLLGISDDFFDGFDNPLQAVKKYENITGAFQLTSEGDEL